MGPAGKPSCFPRHLQINVLGRFSAVRPDGSVIALPKKAQALLFFLLTNRGRSTARRELAELLWSRVEPQQALHSLRQCLFVLLRSLPEDARHALVMNGDGVHLAPTPALRSDLEGFEQALQSDHMDDLRLAEGLYLGPAVEGLSLRREIRFDTWLAAERARLQTSHARVVRQLASGDASRLIVAARAASYSAIVGTSPRHDGWNVPQVVVFPPVDRSEGTSAHSLWAYAMGEEVARSLDRDRMLQVAFEQDAEGPVPTTHGYAVRGSMRVYGDRLRLVVYLSDLATGTCLWSDVFKAAAPYQPNENDTIANQIAARVAHAVRTSEARQNRGTDKIAGLAPQCLLAAKMSRQGRAGNEAALVVLRGVLDRAPEFAVAHALISRCYHVQRIMGWRAPDDSVLEEGIRHAREAIRLGSDNADALWMGGLALLNIEGDLDNAQSAIERAIACDPASTNARLAASFLYCHLGDGDRALARTHEAEALNPADNTHHVLPSAMATAHFVAGDYLRANTACDISLAQRPGYAAALRIKVATAGLLGKREEAAAAAQQLLTVEPHASVARMREYWRWLARNAPDALAAKLEGWRMAHIPE